MFHNVVRESAEDVSDDVKRKLKAISAIVKVILNKLSQFIIDRSTKGKLSEKRSVMLDLKKHTCHDPPSCIIPSLCENNRTIVNYLIHNTKLSSTNLLRAPQKILAL